MRPRQAAKLAGERLDDLVIRRAGRRDERVVQVPRGVQQAVDREVDRVGVRREGVAAAEGDLPARVVAARLPRPAGAGRRRGVDQRRQPALRVPPANAACSRSATCAASPRARQWYSRGGSLLDSRPAPGAPYRSRSAACAVMAGTGAPVLPSWWRSSVRRKASPTKNPEPGGAHWQRSRPAGGRGSSQSLASSSSSASDATNRARSAGTSRASRARASASSRAQDSNTSRERHASSGIRRSSSCDVTDGRVARPARAPRPPPWALRPQSRARCHLERCRGRLPWARRRCRRAARQAGRAGVPRAAGWCRGRCGAGGRRPRWWPPR